VKLLGARYGNVACVRDDDQAAGRLHARKGDIDLAISFLEKCRDAQRLGKFEVWSASISSTVGYAYLLGGRLDEAISLLTEAIEEANATKSMFGHSLRLAYLGEAVLLFGRTEEALQHARCALEVSRIQHERGHTGVCPSAPRRDRGTSGAPGHQGGDSRLTARACLDRRAGNASPDGPVPPRSGAARPAGRAPGSGRAALDGGEHTVLRHGNVALAGKG